jgi:hypothetical protein
MKPPKRLPTAVPAFKMCIRKPVEELIILIKKMKYLCLQTKLRIYPAKWSQHQVEL